MNLRGLLEYRPLNSYSRALFNCSQWLQTIQDNSRATSFLLSLSQFNSHRLLWEVWTGSPETRISLEDSLDIFRNLAELPQPADVPRPGDPRFRLPFVDLPSPYLASISTLYGDFSALRTKQRRDCFARYYTTSEDMPQCMLHVKELHGNATAPPYLFKPTTSTPPRPRRVNHR